ncbi:hypothetical protein [Spongiivirga citrea]|uniref:DUF3278 domain-containing protein n=1 Tax=Spongiivirga citrea TaxID=1481457 RepID=A0A6M0CS61_9FLAO|nr:hypothetical protein [Spongiivirga citrea]NER16710.1 hypothetical protein [Spongiivirga citrea]
MNLEEMKSTWATLSGQLEKQQKLTDTLIMQMTQQRYQNKIGVISFYESLGAVICVAMAAFILFNFNRLDDGLHVALGVYTLLVLIGLPAMVLWSIKRLKQINVFESSYKETITNFNKRRRFFLLVQKLGVAFAYPMFFGSMPVFSKVMGNKSMFENGGSVGLYVFIGIWTIAMFFFVRWGYSKYKNITNSAAKILEDLNDDN